MNRRRAPLAAAASALLVAACGGPQDPQPSGDAAQRIVTLSPHLAEIAFAVGAGERIVGVSAYTNYPEQTASLPVVGDAFNVDQEQLVLLSPDLVLAWQSGTPEHIVDELRTRGFRVEVIRTTTLDEIAAALWRIGALTGHADAGAALAAEFEAQLARLRETYRDAPPISVFYQVAVRPLYTINAAHYLSELIELCGGRNVFADLGDLAPAISVEAVLERDPDVMLASSDAGSSAFDEWRRWPELAANRYGNHFIMPADEIGRATPRLLAAASAMCEALDTARRNRESANDD